MKSWARLWKMRVSRSKPKAWAVLVVLVPLACAATLEFKVKPLPLPGSHGSAMLDYFAYDRDTGLLWVPAGDTASVDVIDTTTDQIRRIEGFAIAQVEFRGKPRMMGPSSVALGDGVAYIGSRADSQICVIDARTLKLDNCIAFAPASKGLASAPDGLIYIAATKELWATSGAPPVGVPAAEKAIKILSASQPTKLVQAAQIALRGSAEGYALDNGHGRFYTNLEETGQTIAIDVRERKVVATWRSCDHPSGVAADRSRGFVFVACSDHVIVLDPSHEGKVVGSVVTGAGVDNIDYASESGWLYVAAQDAAQLTIARIDDSGDPVVLARVPTAKGARSVVAGGNGRAYVIDPLAGQILKVEPSNR